MTEGSQDVQLGFIGLGLMGHPMAANLIKAGLNVQLFSRTCVPQALIDAGGKACKSAAEVAAGADIIFIIVNDTPNVAHVLDSFQGQSLQGKIIVDMSTISPIATREFSDKVAKDGATWVDAPVSGGDIGAKNGTLTIMVGGPKAAFETIRPYLNHMGKTITHIGDVGCGQIAKAANQIVIAGTLQAVGEALIFCRKSGADPAVVREALMGGFAASRILEIHGKRMLDRDFEPGFRTSLFSKDLAIALDTARSRAIPLPATALINQLYNSLMADRDGAEKDFTAVIEVMEQLAGTKLGA